MKTYADIVNALADRERIEVYAHPVIGYGPEVTCSLCGQPYLHVTNGQLSAHCTRYKIDVCPSTAWHGPA